MTNNTLRIGGGVLFWSIGEWSQRSVIKTGLEALGLEKFVPEPRPPSAALKDALEQVFSGKHVLVRPLAKREGFVVVEESRGETDNQYNTVLTAIIDPKTLRIAFSPLNDKAQPVVDAFNRHLGLLRAAQVSGALVAILDSLGGTRLRPSGAIYWLPEHKLDEWAGVCRVIEHCGLGKAHSMYTLRHQMDADAIRAVRDAIVAEVSGEAVRIHAEVMNDDLGDRALETRINQAQECRKKILLYEELLGVGLASLHQAIDKAEQAAGAATLLSSANAGQEVA